MRQGQNNRKRARLRLFTLEVGLRLHSCGRMRLYGMGDQRLTGKSNEALLRDGQVKGSTGTVVLTGKTIRFQFKDSTDATPVISMEYKK